MKTLVAAEQKNLSLHAVSEKIQHRGLSCPDVAICCSYLPVYLRMMIIFVIKFLFQTGSALYDFPHILAVKVTAIAEGCNVYIIMYHYKKFASSYGPVGVQALYFFHSSSSSIEMWNLERL